jgi:hypothetical protein
LLLRRDDPRARVEQHARSVVVCGQKLPQPLERSLRGSGVESLQQLANKQETADPGPSSDVEDVLIATDVARSAQYRVV